MASPRKTTKRRISADESTARERIMKAAREVFALHSYKAASTRMVAKQAGVEHPLIHYYFGSKEKLFQAMVEDIYSEFSLVQVTWLDGIERVPPSQGLPVFIDRMLDYTLAHPDALQIIALNMVQIGRIDDIPGYRYITLHMARMRRMLEERLVMRGSNRDIEMFIYCFYSLMINLIGARSCQAQILNMDPLGEEYRAWIKDACLTLFLPWLERLLLRY